MTNLPVCDIIYIVWIYIFAIVGKTGDIMGKAKKLPSGNYRVREYDYTGEDGIKHYRSFTAETKAKAELMAKEFKAGKICVRKKRGGMTLDCAYKKYIELKEPVLSPSTVREYEKQHKSYLKKLMPKNIEEITEEDVQNAINAEVVKGISPKTVRNIHGLLSSVLKQFRPGFSFNTSLPKKQKAEIKIPEKEEIEKILKYIKGTELEIPILLFSGLGLRRSELCALKWSDIDFKNQTLKIDKALVLDKNKNWVTKPPKTTAGNRIIDIPNYIFSVLKENRKSDGCVTVIKPDAIYRKYKKVLSELNLPSYRLHDLRHYTASVMLALNIPNKYAMEIMGHETENMLNKVYQHTIKEEMKKISLKLDSYHKE